MRSLAGLKSQLERTRTRQLLWVECEQQEIERRLNELLDALEPSELAAGRMPWLVGQTSYAGLKPLKANALTQRLGDSTWLAILDAYSGFNPNSFAQLAGAIEGGGLLVLITPPRTLWPDYQDPEYNSLGWTAEAKPSRPNFLSWLVKRFEEDSHPMMLSEVDLCSGETHSTPESPTAPISPTPYASVDQANLVGQLQTQWREPESTQIVTADRGRGKSWSLGAALALQSSFSRDQILVCAPTKHAAVSLLKGYSVFSEATHRLDVVSPDQCLRKLSSTEADVRLLIIDEAAAMPSPLLTRLASQSAHLVLSTTLHGYEGFARGFGLRFLKRLEQYRSAVFYHRLETPIRWSPADRMEPCVNRLMLLNTAVKELDHSVGLRKIEVTEISRAQLHQQPSLITASFDLLAQAHYRTTPADLRVLLDAPGQRIWLAGIDSEVVGVCWIVEEGGLAPELCDAICKGIRRPRGHLLPQQLLFHEGWPDAGSMRYWRIVRVAVAEPYRRTGIGSALISAIQKQAALEKADFIGTSFALDADVYPFWLRQGFETLRLGEQIDPVAAAPALTLLKPLNSEAKVLQGNAQERFGLRWQRMPRLRDLVDPVVAEHLGMASFSAKECVEGGQELIERFVHYYSPLSQVLPFLQMKLQMHMERVHHCPSERLAELLQLHARERALDRAEIKELRTLVRQHINLSS